jgi:hypothetical protein
MAAGVGSYSLRGCLESEVSKLLVEASSQTSPNQHAVSGENLPADLADLEGTTNEQGVSNVHL